MASKPVLMLTVFMVLKMHLNDVCIGCSIRSETRRYNKSMPTGGGQFKLQETGGKTVDFEDYNLPVVLFNSTFSRPWECDNLNLTETLVFWESVACGGPLSFCGSSRENPYLEEPGELTCDDCVCDDCDIYGDCCLDVSLQRNVSGDRLNSLECLSGTKGWKSSVTPTAQSYLFVSRCPQKYLNVQTREACENRNRQVLEALSDPPVYSPLSRLSYINSHCAKCHDETEKTKMWMPNLVCRESLDLQAIKSKADMLGFTEQGSACHVSFSPPPYSPVRMCQRLGPIGECNVTGAWPEYDPVLQEACGMYSHVVHVYGQRYRNVFCAMCNGELNRTPEGLVEIRYHPSFNPRFPDIIPEGIAGSVVPFSRIFDLTPEAPSLPTSDKTECLGNSVFDTFKKNCRELVCSAGRMLRNHSCIGALQTARGEAFRLHFHIAPEKLNGKPGEIWEAFQVEMRRFSSRLDPCYQRLDMYEYNETEQISSVTTKRMWLEYTVIVGKVISQEEAESYLLNTPNSSWFVYNLPGRSDFYTVLSGNDSAKLIRNTLYKTETHATTLCSKTLNQTSIITLHKLSRCNQIELEDSEFTINNATGVITLTASGDEPGVTEYFAFQDKIRICVNFSGWYQSETKGSVDETEYWLTLISLAVSLSALFLTFLLSLYSKSRNTVPGLITIMLVVTIFLAQGLFLFLPHASSNMWTCQIIGLLAHYSWLVVFAWKNVAAFHMYAAFTQPFTNRSTNRQRILLKYALYAFGTPAVLVMLYIVTQVELLNHERFGYTHDCFLAAPVDLGLAFVAPVSLVLLVNGYFFTRVVYVLKKMSEFEKNSNQSNSSHTTLFIKMSLILGFMWAAGFLGNMLDVKALWYVFDALNGGVGLLILVIQLSNKQFLYRVKKALWASDKLTATTTTEHGGTI